jgi:hypothetical protein
MVHQLFVVDGRGVLIGQIIALNIPKQLRFEEVTGGRVAGEFLANSGCHDEPSPTVTISAQQLRIYPEPARWSFGSAIQSRIAAAGARLRPFLPGRLFQCEVPRLLPVNQGGANVVLTSPSKACMIPVSDSEGAAMQRQITLTIMEGSLRGKGFTLEDRGRYIIGRAEDCDIVLCGAEDSLGVSRHHCVLALEPPVLRVRDLGSRNGTFVNGVCIGRRLRLDPTYDHDLDEAAEFQLHDGDDLRVGCFTFEVRIHETSELRAPFYYFPVNLN